MKGPKDAIREPRSTHAEVATELHEEMIRRATNHNAHVITPHGTVHAGRKGRSTPPKGSSGDKK